MEQSKTSANINETLSVEVGGFVRAGTPFQIASLPSYVLPIAQILGTFEAVGGPKVFILRGKHSDLGLGRVIRIALWCGEETHFFTWVCCHAEAITFKCKY